MKNPLSRHIQKFIFDQNFFDKIYQENPKMISQDPSLLFKSIVVSNASAFCWLIKKVDIEPVFKELFYLILKNIRFPAYLKVLSKAYPEFFAKRETQSFLFKTLILNLYSSNQDKTQYRLKLVNKLAQSNDLIEAYHLNIFISQKESHHLMIKAIQSGIIPVFKDDFFARFCRYGDPKYVSVFKEIGCDMHYLNDLALINAAEFKNEEMVRYLIEHEGCNPCVGNNFPMYSVFHENEYYEKESISDDLIMFFAKYCHSKNIDSSVIAKLGENKQFQVSYQYVVTNKSLADKQEIHKNKINKI